MFPNSTTGLGVESRNHCCPSLDVQVFEAYNLLLGILKNMLNTLWGEETLQLNSNSLRRLQFLRMQGGKRGLAIILTAIIAFDVGEGSSGKVNSKLTI